MLDQQGQSAPIRVEIPNLGVVEFPAGTSEAAMTKAIQDQLASQKQTTKTPATVGQKAGAAIGGVIEGAGLNPLPLLEAMASEAGNPHSGLTLPVRQAIAVLSPLAKIPGAWKALTEGRFKDAANEFSASIPILGPAAETTSTAMKSADPLERARGYGQAAGMIASPFMGEGIARVAGATKAAVVNKAASAVKNANPVEAAAVQYVADRGVPVDAGTMTGNAFLKGTRNMVDRSIGGASVAQKAAQAQSKGLQTLGEHLAQKAHALPATPETAATAVTKALEKRIADFHEQANVSYGELRKLEEANVQKVITGSGPSRTGVVRAVTQTADMGFPVQMKPVKAAMKPVYDRMLQTMPIAQQQASAGLKALENIVNGPDLVPASVADANLSAMKAIVREADMPELRNVSQGMAASAVRQLSDAVDKAVLQGGPAATKALQKGRAATKAKYATAELLDQLNAEPVRAYRQGTAPKDTNITLLRELAKEAPNEVPKIGRAYLDEMLDRATGEGGFTGAARMASDWEKLGAETKEILFANTPGLSDELDKFFLAAKKLAENPNPSGTGAQNFVTAQHVGAGAALMGGPLAMGAYTGGQLTAYGLAKALRSPSTLRILRQGMTAKPNTLNGALLRQTIQRLNAQEAQKK